MPSYLEAWLFRNQINSSNTFHARIQKVLSEGVQLWQRFFLLMRGGRIQMPLWAGHHQPDSETAFKWLFADNDGPTLNAGLLALWFSGDRDQYCLETLYFCDFSGGVRTPVSPLDQSDSVKFHKLKQWLYIVDQMSTYSKILETSKAAVGPDFSTTLNVDNSKYLINRSEKLAHTLFYTSQRKLILLHTYIFFKYRTKVFNISTDFWHQK